MAKLSIQEREDREQKAQDLNWEEESYRTGCEAARNAAIARLKAIDDRLMSDKPKDLRVATRRERTLTTRFGDVTINRRMYRTPEGEARFLLDERMGWKPRQLASPSIAERVVEMATYMPFRKVSETVSALTAGALSANTVHRLLQGVGEEALLEERERVEAQFGRGEKVCEGEQKADVLYMEADGVWVPVQREKAKHYEVKCAIAYTGWNELSEGRYELVDKRVYAHGAPSDVSFWEGASLEWGKRFALGEVKRFVVGGDGANWIREGARYFPNAVFQLDGFHLARACGIGYGKERGSAIYDAIRSGDAQVALGQIAQAAPAETNSAVKNRKYTENNVVVGVDWRNLVPDAPVDARSLGTMESNGDKLTANRMKKRGMSWTIRGANHMAKVIQLCRNGELSVRCRNSKDTETEGAVVSRRSRRRSTRAARGGGLPETAMPVLTGSHASRPWATSLRRLTQPHILN